MQENSIVRECLAHRIKQLLLTRILDGTYPPGHRLVELQIAHELKTSQAPVREALCQLEAAGLIETEPYRGTRVRAVSEREMREAYQVRAVLEELAAQLGIARLQKEIKLLQSEAEASIAAARKGDLNGYVTHNLLFHRTIVCAADNQVLQRTWESLEFSVGSHARLAPGKFDVLNSAREHIRIAAAIERADAKEAGRLLRLHSESLIPVTALANEPREHQSGAASGRLTKPARTLKPH